MVLLNGGWDTGGGRIPSLVAEVRGVKLEEMGAWGGGACWSAGSVATPSPHGSDSGLGSDSPDRNLSWLLNFKLDELPGLEADGSAAAAAAGVACGAPGVFAAVRRPEGIVQSAPPPLQRTGEDARQAAQVARPPRPPHPQGARKPPFTYTELIEHALREKGELTVSGIYQWIS